LSLIDYDPEYQQVMEFVFGGKFICFNLETAKKIAYHPQILQSTITLDGDCFDPEGTLSGGARAERANILVRLGEMKSNIDELNRIQNELISLEQEINKEREKSVQFSRKKNELDMQLNKLNLVKTSLEQTTHHQKLEKFNNINLEITEQRNEIENSTKELCHLEQKKKDLEEKIASGNDTEKEKKKAKAKIDAAKLDLDKKLKSSAQLEQVI
jgi:structural maintenance of chromosome 2